MQQIASELALAQNPVSDTEFQISILNQSGEDYRPIISAIRIRNTPMSMIELSDILTDHERFLQASEDAVASLIPTANNTQRYLSHGSSQSDSRKREISSSNGHRARSSQRSSSTTNGYSSQSSSTGRSTPICRFCNFPGHVVKDCRKLARFLRDNHLSASPMVHHTMTNAGSSQPWMFDSGASHHTASGVASLQEFSTYDGPDEIRLGNGSENGKSAHEG
ncbi:unnamed protein product [Cuscuta epithymum]|uniref:CCHC-type domain-containing protein n=3 Tax=Cuscuta epithymum TaxID=186058 RepID=A0AAV0GFU5_9ASTE|nr:unnamed protein product [Cuscuta epithymum]